MILWFQHCKTLKRRMFSNINPGKFFTIKIKINWTFFWTGTKKAEWPNDILNSLFKFILNSLQMNISDKHVKPYRWWMYETFFIKNRDLIYSELKLFKRSSNALFGLLLTFLEVIYVILKNHLLNGGLIKWHPISY